MSKSTNKSAHYGQSVAVKGGIIAQSKVNTTSKNGLNRKNHRSTSGNNRDNGGNSKARADQKQDQYFQLGAQSLHDNNLSREQL